MSEVSSLKDGLGAASRSAAAGDMVGASDQLHDLAVLADAQERSPQYLADGTAQLRHAIVMRDTIGQANGMLR